MFTSSSSFYSFLHSLIMITGFSFLLSFFFVCVDSLIYSATSSTHTHKSFYVFLSSSNKCNYSQRMFILFVKKGLRLRFTLFFFQERIRKRMKYEATERRNMSFMFPNVYGKLEWCDSSISRSQSRRVRDVSWINNWRNTVTRNGQKTAWTLGQGFFNWPISF